MIQKYVFVLIMLVGMALPGVARAEVVAPNVYVFGAEQCDYCQRAVKFLRRLHTDRGGFKLHEFDIVASSDDATLFVQVIAAIGLSNPVVPMVIVGREVMLGFQSDETSGREIQGHIERCHVDGCRDPLRSLIAPTQPFDVATAGPWVVHRRWAGAALRR